MDVNFNPKAKNISKRGSKKEKELISDEKNSQQERDISQGIKAEDAMGRASFAMMSKKGKNDIVDKDDLLQTEDILDIEENFKEIIEEISEGVSDPRIDEITDYKEKQCIIDAYKKGLFTDEFDSSEIKRNSLNTFAELYKSHPEFAKELVDHNYSLVQNDLNTTYKMFNGSEDGAYKPLNPEQREFAFDLAHRINKRGECFIGKSSKKLNNTLLYMPKEYYNITKFFAPRCNYLYAPWCLMEDITDSCDKNPENFKKLNEIIEKRKNKNCPFEDALDTALENIDHVEEALDHGINISSIKKLKENYPKIYEKLMDNLENHKENNQEDWKNPGVLQVVEIKGDEHHIRLQNYKGGRSVHKETIEGKNTGNISLRFDIDTGDLVSVVNGDFVQNTATGTTTATSVKNNGKYNKIVRHSINRDGKQTDIVKTHSEIAGEYEIKEIENGRSNLTGLAELDYKEGKHVEQHLTSLDGTITDFIYADDKTGNKFLYYKITDKDGKELYKNSKSFAVIDENHFKSRDNDNYYDIVFDDKKVTVKKTDKAGTETGEEVVYDIKEFNKEPSEAIDEKMQEIAERMAKAQNKNVEDFANEVDNNIDLAKDIMRQAIIEYAGEHTIDKKLVPMLKGLSGDEWFALKQNGTSFIGGGYNDNDNACSILNAILMSEQHSDRLAIFEHELGHQKYHTNDFENDEEFIKTYEAEKKLFTESFPDADIKDIQYFLRKKDDDDDHRGRNETSAETNLILNSFQCWTKLEDRTILLKTYFPRTLAYIGNKNRECLKNAAVAKPNTISFKGNIKNNLTPEEEFNTFTENCKKDDSPRFTVRERETLRELYNEHGETIRNLVNLELYKSPYMKHCKSELKLIDLILDECKEFNTEDKDLFNTLLISLAQKGIKEKSPIVDTITIYGDLYTREPNLTKELIHNNLIYETPISEYNFIKDCKLLDIDYLKILRMQKSDALEPRFDKFDYEGLTKSAQIDKNTTLGLINMHSANGDWRCASKEILGLTDNITPENENLIFTLLRAENGNGEYKYSAKDILEIAKIINETKDYNRKHIIKTLTKITSMKDKKGNDRFKDLTPIIKAMNNDTLGLESYMNFLSEIHRDGTFKYSCEIADELADSEDKPWKNFRETKKCYDKAVEYMHSQDITDYKMIEDIEHSSYNHPIFVSESTANDEKIKIKRTIKFDEDGNLMKDQEDAYTQDGDIISTIKTDDASINYDARTSIGEFKGDQFTQLDFSNKVITDDNGNVVLNEYYVASPDYPNKYNIIRETPTGLRYNVGLAEISESGDKIIEKNITAKDRTKTKYLYVESPDGSRMNYTQIVDKDGNTLLENKQKFKIIDENHFESVENGVKYDIQYTKDKVKVKKDNGETVEISIGDNEVGSKGIISRDLVHLTKRLPGSAYFDIKHGKLEKIGMDIDDVRKNNAHYTDEWTRLIAVSKGLSDAEQISVLLHELGHYKDKRNIKKIRNDGKVLEIYDKEREAFWKESSNFETGKLDYFTKYYHKNDGGAITEMIAEVNSLLYSTSYQPNTQMRAELMQEYFPKTFAAIANLMLKEIPEKY